MPTSARLVTGALLTGALLLGAACTPGLDWQPTPVDVYRESFHGEAGTRFVASQPRAELLATLAPGNVLWLGDQHVSSRLHTVHTDVLVSLAANGVPLVLGLEAVGTQDEARVRRFVAGEGSLDELRADLRKRWRASWLDDPELDPWYYRWLVTFARKQGLPVYSLEPTPRLPLGERDRVLAAKVQAIAKAHPDRIVVVVVGQAHLLGDGDLVWRVGVPGLTFGGEPPEALAEASPDDASPGTVCQSDGGLWWFAEALRVKP